jgi:hypothetical protein
MAVGDVTIKYGTSTDLAVTTLVDVASSATWVAGWESAVIDNTSTKWVDFLISGALTILHDGTPTAGEIRVYIVAMIADDVYPDVFDGTESVETISLANVRDAVCKLGAVIVNTATVHLTYPFGPFSVANLFGGVCPPKFVVFITHNTTTTLDHDGQTVTYQGIGHNVAAS